LTPRSPLQRYYVVTSTGTLVDSPNLDMAEILRCFSFSAQDATMAALGGHE